MTELQQSSPSLRHQQRIQAINARRAHALAYLPLMGVGTSWLARTPMGEPEISERRAHTTEQALAHATKVNQLSDWESSVVDNRVRLATEAACTLLGHYQGATSLSCTARADSPAGR